MKTSVFFSRYVPELRHYPAEYIYEPWTAPPKVQEKAGCIVGKEYPDRIVKHKVRDLANVKIGKLKLNSKLGITSGSG